jgi:hypothetical protein
MPRTHQELVLARLDHDELRLLRIFRHCSPTHRQLILSFARAAKGRAVKDLPPNVVTIIRKIL